MSKAFKYFLSASLLLLLVGVFWWNGPSRFESAEKMRDRFISYATEMTSLRRLQIVQLKQMEIFERKSEANVPGTRLPLPDVVIRVQIPVEYNFYVDLGEPWKFELQGDEAVIVAPKLKPGTPAANISEMTFEVKKGSLFRNEKEVTRNLQGQITSLLRSRSESHTGLVREVARKELENIARAWMKAENKNWRLRVYFADENIEHPKH